MLDLIMTLFALVERIRFGEATKAFAHYHPVFRAASKVSYGIHDATNDEKAAPVFHLRLRQSVSGRPIKAGRMVDHLNFNRIGVTADLQSDWRSAVEFVGIEDCVVACLGDGQFATAQFVFVRAVAFQKLPS